MSLHTLQCALAELFTDRDARERFEHDAAGFAKQRGLTDRDCEQLAVLSASAIPGYAATLVRKRCAEAVRLLPKTRAALGEAFEPAFAAWAARAGLPAGEHRYTLDAEAFARSLLAGGSAGTDVRAAIRHDRAHIRASLGPRWLKTLLGFRPLTARAFD